MDERQWLLATAYNTGTECLQFVIPPLAMCFIIHPSFVLLFDVSSSSSMLDEAKRWFEASTVICRFVPGGQQRAEKVRGVCSAFLLLQVPFGCRAHVHFFSFTLPFRKISETYSQLLARYGAKA